MAAFELVNTRSFTRDRFYTKETKKARVGDANSLICQSLITLCLCYPVDCYSILIVLILAWPRSSFRFFCKMLWKNSNELLGQPNIREQQSQHHNQQINQIIEWNFKNMVNYSLVLLITSTNIII